VLDQLALRINITCFLNLTPNSAARDAAHFLTELLHRGSDGTLTGVEKKGKKVPFTSNFQFLTERAGQRKESDESQNRIIESFRLEKTFKTIESRR